MTDLTIYCDQEQFSRDSIGIAPLPATMSSLRVDDGLLPEPWADVGPDGNVIALDMDRARAAAAIAGRPPLEQSLPRAIAALIIEAYNRGFAAGEAKAT